MKYVFLLYVYIYIAIVWESDNLSRDFWIHLMKWELTAASSKQANYIMTAFRFKLFHGPFPPPSLSPEEVVQVQSQGHVPAAEAHFQSPTLRQTLLLTFLLVLIPVSNKMLLKCRKQWRLKVLPSTLSSSSICPALHPKSPQKREDRSRSRDCNAF